MAICKALLIDSLHPDSLPPVAVCERMLLGNSRVTLVGLIIAIFGVAFMFGGSSRYCHDASASDLGAGGAGRRHEVWLSESYSRNIAFELGAQSDGRSESTSSTSPSARSL